MAKQLILAVAGSGKTRRIVESLNNEQRFLIVTYTDANESNLRSRVIAKFGKMPLNVHIFTYFSFLYNFCYKPYLSDVWKAKGICWDDSKINRFASSNTREFYTDPLGRLFHSRIAKLCMPFANDIQNRIDKFYDCFLVDEVQDFASHDFDLLMHILPNSADSLLVGDYYQHTYDTSRDGNKKKGLHSSIENFKNAYRKYRVSVDESSLSHSYRCPQEICDYVNTHIGYKINSAIESGGEVRMLEDKCEIKKILEDDSVPKLFYQKAYTYSGRCYNWGTVKGIDSFQDVCVVLNRSAMKVCPYFEKLPSITKNKLYVAMTRAHRNVYLLDEKRLKNI